VRLHCTDTYHRSTFFFLRGTERGSRQVDIKIENRIFIFHLYAKPIWPTFLYTFAYLHASSKEIQNIVLASSKDDSVGCPPRYRCIWDHQITHQCSGGLGNISPPPSPQSPPGLTQSCRYPGESDLVSPLASNRLYEDSRMRALNPYAWPPPASWSGPYGVVVVQPLRHYASFVSSRFACWDCQEKPRGICCVRVAMEGLPMLQPALLAPGCSLSLELQSISLAVASVILPVAAFGASYGASLHKCPCQTLLPPISRTITHTPSIC
jgi:hypothetical protein